MVSAQLIPLAKTLTRTSPSFGTGLGTSSREKTCLCENNRRKPTRLSQNSPRTPKAISTFESESLPAVARARLTSGKLFGEVLELRLRRVLRGSPRRFHRVECPVHLHELLGQAGAEVRLRLEVMTEIVLAERHVRQIGETLGAKLGFLRLPLTTAPSTSNGGRRRRQRRRAWPARRVRPRHPDPRANGTAGLEPRWHPPPSGRPPPAA